MLEVLNRSGVYWVETYLEEKPALLRAEAIALLTKETKAIKVNDDGNNNGNISS